MTGFGLLIPNWPEAVLPLASSIGLTGPKVCCCCSTVRLFLEKGVCSDASDYILRSVICPLEVGHTGSIRGKALPLLC